MPPESSPSFIARLRQLLGAAETEPTARALRPWFALAMLYAVGCAILALRQAFASPYMLADDAREHVFWMFRFINPGFFPQDSMADYFQSLAPNGYAGLYWLLSRAGLDPLLASKLLPSVLSLVATGYFFHLAARFFRSPAAATLGAVLFAQCLWLNSDLASATPRAFFYPLFVAFLYYQMRRSALGVLVTISLAALFFPPAALLSLGVMGADCLQWKGGLKIYPATGAQVYLVFAAAIGLTLLCLWPYFHQVQAFGPLVTYAAALQMPEFGVEGRVPVFLPSWWGYWVGGNAGIHNLPTRPPWFLAALLWPVLRHFPDRFPLLKAVPSGARPVPQIIGASLFLFFSAHLLLFQLYLPNRYTQSVTRVLLTLLAAGVLLALADAALLWAGKRFGGQRSTGKITVAILAVLFAATVSYPLLVSVFPTAGYLAGTDSGLYQFFARQPATIRIASVADEANNLPLLCQRSIIAGAECAVPFHLGYYLPLRERGRQIARAQYTADSTVLEKCVQDQKIDFWLLDRAAFAERYWRKSRLLRQLRLSPPDDTLGIAAPGMTPLLARAPRAAIAYEDARFIVLDARRLSLKQNTSADK
ncbi:MAG: hypothetical protein ABI787_05350 [Spartobacteria bacterium]